MESFLQKYNWVLHLGLIGLAAIFLALAVNQYVAIQLAPYTVPELPAVQAPAPKKAAKPRPSRQAQYAGAIVDRCLFGCAEVTPPGICPEGCPEGEVCQNGECVPAVAEGGMGSDIPVPSDLSIKLMGAMVAADPQYSLALLSDGGKQSYIVGVDDTVEGGVVVEILRDRIILRRNGRLEFIRLQSTVTGNPALTNTFGARRPPSALGPGEKGAPVKQRAAPSDVEGAPQARAERPSGPDVRRVGDTYELDRSAVEAQLQNPQELARQARVLPNFKDGKKHGIKLVGIAPDSVYSKIGIRSGDVVVGINGEHIDSQNEAFQLLNSLRGQSEAAIEIERGGRKQTVKYRLK